MKLAVALLSALLVGCITVGREGPGDSPGFIIGYDFANGYYSDLLVETFGDEVKRQGINYFVLPNSWAPVERNGLSVTRDRVRYVEEAEDRLRTHDVQVLGCPELSRFVAAFYDEAEKLMAYSSGAASYSNPGYFDGADFVIEIHYPNASIIVQPRNFPGNFPLVRAAYRIIEALDYCDER